MAHFIPQYKCARCGEMVEGEPVELRSDAAEDACAAFIGMTYRGRFAHDAAIRELAPAIVHICTPGISAGVAYFVGFQEVV